MKDDDTPQGEMAVVSKATTTIRDMAWPAAFIACMAWLVWYFPRFIIFAGLANDNLNSGYLTAGAIDFALLAGAVVTLLMGLRAVRTTAGEGVIETPVDRLSLFLGRVTMLLVVILVAVMAYEVTLRYVFERPTLWANEMSLWMAGFIFLLSGLYAMQQRSHIRIYLLYDVLPRGVQRVCDVISTSLICLFAAAMLWGSWNEARDKFLRWETFGTAFDPPIPATLKPLILLVMVLVALQAVANLIADWRKGPESHGVIDGNEVEEMIQTARAQHEQGRHD